MASYLARHIHRSKNKPVVRYNSDNRLFNFNTCSFTYLRDLSNNYFFGDVGITIFNF